jgi:hypothetical protein
VKELEAAWTKHMEEFRALASQDMPADQGKSKVKRRKKAAQ